MNSTDITVLLDRSGSMATIKNDMEGGFAEYLRQLRLQPGEATVTLAQFDDVYETVYTAQPLATAPGLVLQPRGSTALLDAMSRVITETGARLSALPQDRRPDRVLILVVTDGQENASQKTKRADLVAAISHQRDVYKWEFVYLGANQDAFAEAGSMGVSLANVANFQPTSGGIQAAYRSAALCTNSYRGGGNANIASDDDQS